ncbi:MAG: hypothetical protein WCA19_19300 [Candidatus Acidiferrales bacterium]
MIFPKPEVPDLLMAIRVSVLLISGSVATASYYWIVVRLKKVGVRTPMIVTVKTLRETFSTYRRLAMEQGWPIWPVAAYWIAGAIALIDIITVYHFKK